MDNVERILSFIDENNNEPEEAEEQPKQQPEQANNTTDNITTEQPAEQQQNNVNESTGEYTNINNTNANYDYTRDDKQYKSMLRKLNNNIKKSRYPCIIEIGGEGSANMMFNNESELKTYLNNLKDESESMQKNILKTMMNY